MPTPEPPEEFAEGTDTIAAIASPPGKGGISIVRVSGPRVPAIADGLMGGLPTPRMAECTAFRDRHNTPIDHGIVLYFPAPQSYTGEHVLEMQGHGSPVVMGLLLRRCLELGCRHARPGEFSERAFLNGKLDLVQAEAVADLIESSHESAARSALRSLQGSFSVRIHDLVDTVCSLRLFIEAAIDFPEEEIDFLEDSAVIQRLDRVERKFAELRQSVQQGKLLRDGLKVVLTGLPNAGKSSLLNALSDEQRAIVSRLPGTTRDTLEQTILLDGLPVEIIDTAGIRDATDEIEAEGVRRARHAQQEADLILVVIDDAQVGDGPLDSVMESPAGDIRQVVVRNKIDLSGRTAAESDGEVCISALTGQGLPDLKRKIQEIAGFRGTDDSGFMARERHLDALDRAEGFLKSGLQQQRQFRAGELLADDLHSCQKALGEITGEISSEDLLGMIFSSFCIGK